MEAVLPIIGAIALFLGGMFLRDKLARRKDAKAKTTAAQHTAEERVHKAEERYHERMENAKDAIEQDMAVRPVTNDPVADLTDRLRRNADRIRARQRRRNGASP